MHVAFAAAAIVCAFAAEAPGQTAPTPNAPLRFEVASVKPNTTTQADPGVGGASGASMGRRGDRFVALNRPLREIIRFAYELEPFESIEGGPRWLDDPFDIIGVIPGPAAAADPSRAMLRTLLDERFGLVVRWSTREQPVHALVLARRDGRLGPGLIPSTTNCEGRAVEPSRPPASGSLSAAEYEKLTRPVCDLLIQPFRARIRAGARTLDDLAAVLSRSQALKAPVVNRTGLTARFDFDVSYAPQGAGAAPPVPASPEFRAPTLSVALEEQLGLRLESARGRVRVLIIEALEPPSPD